MAIESSNFSDFYKVLDTEDKKTVHSTAQEFVGKKNSFDQKAANEVLDKLLKDFHLDPRDAKEDFINNSTEYALEGYSQLKENYISLQAELSQSLKAIDQLNEPSNIPESAPVIKRLETAISKVKEIIESQKKTEGLPTQEAIIREEKFYDFSSKYLEALKKTIASFASQAQAPANAQDRYSHSN